MFLERRNNGIWYYKKTWVVAGARKVFRKSLNTYDKKEAQLRAMEVYFNLQDCHTSTQAEVPESKAFDVSSGNTEGFDSQLNTTTEAPVESVSNNLNSIINAYIAENSHLWGVKEVKAQQSAIERFIKQTHIVNLEDCTKAVAVDFKQSLISSGLSNITINKLIGKLSSLFDYINSHYEHPNIFNGLKIKRVKQETKREAYTQQEATKLIKFAHAQPQQHYKFMILLGLFTGCRANELAQLYTSDIVKIDGIWSILIQATKQDQKLKTNNAQRVIPVHSELIKAGFIDYVKSKDKECRLFPEFKYSEIDGCSKAFVQWFLHNKPVNKTFHEIRHSFATQLRNHDVSLNIAAQLLGHGTGAISFGRYGSTAQTQIHILKKAVEYVSYN
ncbi:site-specific integrase [Aeromonas diversa]|uniref:site-specific integrase n=1 Tax=Aeromonas diversa TaxID=502790 RepID=UPI0039A1608B